MLNLQRTLTEITLSFLFFSKKKKKNDPRFIKKPKSREWHCPKKWREFLKKNPMYAVCFLMHLNLNSNSASIMVNRNDHYILLIDLFDFMIHNND